MHHAHRRRLLAGREVVVATRSSRVRPTLTRSRRHGSAPCPRRGACARRRKYVLLSRIGDRHLSLLEVIGVGGTDLRHAREHHPQVMSERLLGPLGVAVGHRRHDGAVLGDHLGEVPGLRQAQSPHAVEVAVRPAAEPPRDVAAAQLAEAAAGRGVACRTRRRRPPARRAPARRGWPAAPRAAPAWHARSRAGSRCTRVLAHERGVSDGLVRDQRHERAQLRDDRHEPVVAQARERLADRGGSRRAARRASFSDSLRPGSSSALTMALSAA